MISKTCGVPVRMSILPAKTRGITKSPKGGIQPKSTRIFKIGENGHTNRGKITGIHQEWWIWRWVTVMMNPKTEDFYQTKRGAPWWDLLWIRKRQPEIVWYLLGIRGLCSLVDCHCAEFCGKLCMCVSTLESGSRLRNPFSLHNYQNSRQVQVGLLLLTSLLGNLQ